MSPHIARKAMDLLMITSIGSMEDIATEKNSYNLSNREMEVLKLTVDGYRYKEVAEKLYVSIHTVRTHIGNIYQKLHVTSKTQPIKIATKNNLI